MIDIGAMIKYEQYTYDIMLEEIKKTRLLCQFCHYIVTQNQHKDAKINNFIFINKDIN